MKRKKALAVILCSTLMAMSFCSCSLPFGVSDANTVTKVLTSSDEEILTDVVSKVAGVGSSEAGKEETVFVKTDASGSVNSIIVSDHLKNTEKTAQLEDETYLTDIVNVKGKETYKADGTKLTWSANGSDIYYQGTTDKKLPVDVNITYELDSKEIAAKDLAGKSGHVKITLNYKNNSANIVKIGGKDETIYTPFAAVSALTLDEEKFRNIKVTNGAAVADGKRNIIVGMAFPGLVESLNGGKAVDSKLLENIEDEISIPENVVIEADVTDFESGMIITLVTSDITRAIGLDAIDLDSNTSMSDMKDSMDKFSSAGKELADGTGALKDGAQKLADGSNSLASGSNSLYNGVVEYTNGASQLAGGISKLDSGAVSLDEGAGKLQSGLSQAKEGANALSNGISSVESGAKQVSDGATTLSDNAAQLSSGATSLKEGVDTLAATVGTITSGVGTAANAAGQISAGIDQVVAATAAPTDPSTIDTSAILSGVDLTSELQKLNLTGEQMQALSTYLADKVAREAAAAGANQAKVQINAALTTAGESGQSLQSGASVLATSLSTSYGQLTSAESQAKIKALTDGAAALEAGAVQFGEGAAKLSEGATALYNGTTQLSSGANSLTGGLSELYTGAGNLKDGTATLKAGTAELAGGANKLTSASGTLVNGSKALADGSAQLSNGASELLNGTVKLNDGMIKFNDEGISKLTKVFDTDMDGMKDRIKAISDMGKAYNTFAGAGEDEDCTVKFIIESEQIKKL